MSETAEKLKGQLVNLSTKERAELASFLIRSLDEATDDDAESQWDAELERRAQDIKNGTAIGQPAAQVFAELREKYS
jgi:putative addiction module component (TIGR02574 family)